MPITHTVSRIGDDAKSVLIVSTDEDNDMHIGVKRGDTIAYVEFCTGIGGGRSLKVRKALMKLYKAIEEENKRDTLAAGGENDVF